MKKIMTYIVGATLAAVFSGAAVLAEDKDDNGGLISLRGETQLAEGQNAEDLKKVAKTQDAIERGFLHQPPLINHKIDKYQVNLKTNKCLSCHGWKNYRKEKATKISLTHFETRDGEVLSNVSPRRYFCSQCHAPQTDGEPLIDNVFSTVGELK
ncbi:MAG: nitrate reductase cytochrome c-type subunit [Gammaproteobacteria bacterium]|nr:nitrate reductase cytochrome c-type subunit [Gammaproteobacteria bacterium]